MFSTLLGALPPDPDQIDQSADERVRANLADLGAIGLELISNGEPLDVTAPPDPGAVVAAWSRAAAASTLPVKAVLPGPYSAGRREQGPGAAAAWADELRPAIAGLAEAGCPLVEIHEADALAIGVVATERRRFVDAHRRLTEGFDAADAIHLSLTLIGGNLDAAGPATFFDLPYASYAFDLIDGPDNWRLIAAAPTDRGIVCGALSPRPGADETRDVLVWAAHYAASTGGRGRARVGLANSSSLAGLPRADALRKLRIVADAARIAAVESSEELIDLLDPRAMGRRRHRRARG
jgi:methionine synthase II (cobalamin-independent)